MSEIIKVRWLVDQDQNKIAPKTLSSQVINEDGTLFKDTVNESLNNLKDTVVTKEYVEALYTKLNSNTVLGFYCIEDVTITTNGISKVYPANSNVEVSFIEGDTFEIIPTSDRSILALTAFPSALGIYYPWLEGVRQFSNILFDMNNVDMYSKWSQGNQGMYQVQFAQYSNCIFWSDNPYIKDVNKRTNYTLYYTSQLPICYSTIPDNTFKTFFLALGVNSDPNWGNPLYRESFAKANWPTQVFSYYGARTVGLPALDSSEFNIILPKDCRGLMFDSRYIENAGVFDAVNTTDFGAKSGSWRDAFGFCISLKSLYIKNLKVNLNISWSPIDYNSIYYIISEAANTNKITISVSPYTYNLLSQSDFDLAASKNITIELLTANYIEDKRLSDIANKADKDHVHDVYETKEDAQLKYDTIVEAKADWSQNDENAIDYVKNRTHWVEGEIITESIIPETNQYFERNTNEDGSISTHCYPFDNLEQYMEMTEGDTYIVTFDGVEYRCISWIAGTGRGRAVYIGNQSIFDSIEENGEFPFIIQTYSNGLSLQTDVFIYQSLGNAYHTIKVELLVSDSKEYHPLDEKFIPDTIARQEYVDATFARKEDVQDTDLSNYYNKEETNNLLEAKANVEEPRFGGSMGMNHTGELGWTSVSLGFANEASGMYCFAEGMGNKSTGDSSHSEGTGNTASGMASHAEGSGVLAEGVGAHAEGANTKAIGYGSHAEGSNTIASAEGQHVEGKYNIDDANYVHIIGNGTSNTKRSNAHTLDWSGNAWYQGTIKVGGSSFDDASEVALKSDIPTEYTHFILIDSITGNKYKLEMSNGSLTSSLVEPEKTLISFSVELEEYQAEEGMAWAEWVESDYNTDGFEIVDTGDDYGITICKGSFGIYQSSEWDFTQSTDLIISGGQYKINTSEVLA